MKSKNTVLLYIDLPSFTLLQAKLKRPLGLSFRHGFWTWQTELRKSLSSQVFENFDHALATFKRSGGRKKK